VATASKSFALDIDFIKGNALDIYVDSESFTQCNPGISILEPAMKKLTLI
jgi:hypothetical protein